MDPIAATVVAIIIMVIGMVILLLTVTRKAYNHKWGDDDPIEEVQAESLSVQANTEQEQKPAL